MSQPSPLSSRRRAWRTSGWSSATRMRARCRMSAGGRLRPRRLGGHQSFTSHPSRSRTMRLPYAAFASECVTWMMVVPSRLSGREQLHDLAALAGVQVAGRLVGEDERRLRDERARHAHQLLLAAGELRGIQVLLPDDLEPVEHVAHHAVALLPLHVAVRQRHVEVLVHGQVIDQVVALEDEADVRLLQLGALLLPERVNRLAVQVVLARPRRVVHAEDVQQRGLAGARRPHDRHELAGREVERDPAQDVGRLHALLVGLLDVPQADDRAPALGELGGRRGRCDVVHARCPLNPARLYKRGTAQRQRRRPPLPPSRPGESRPLRPRSPRRCARRRGGCCDPRGARSAGRA